MLPLLLACAADPKPTDDTSADTSTDTSGDTSTDTSSDTSGPAPFFHEPFDTVDLTRWTPADWQLGATQLDAGHATATDGALALLHEADGAGGWLGAELYTTETFTGGRWEAEMARPASTGTVCATFFYGADRTGHVNEIDIELLPDAAWFSVYRDWTEADGYDPSPTHDSVQWAWPADFDPSALHVYRIDWGASELTFAVDGAEVGGIPMVPTAPLPLHVNHWTSTTWGDVGYPPPDRSVCRIASITGADLPPEG